jgi:hypothetical protein
MKGKLTVLMLAILLAGTIPIYLSLTTKNKFIKVSVVVSGVDTDYSLFSDKDGFLGTYKGEKNTVKLSIGKHKLEATALDYEDAILNTEIISNTKEIKLTIAKKTAQETATQVSSSSGVESQGAKFFAEGTWLVARLKNLGPNGDSEIIISKKINNQWQPVTQGSSIDTSILDSEKAPADLITYVGSL